MPSSTLDGRLLQGAIVVAMVFAARILFNVSYWLSGVGAACAQRAI